MIDLVLTPDPTESMIGEIRYTIWVKISICELTDFKKDYLNNPLNRTIEINAAQEDTIDQPFTWTPAECAPYFPMSSSFEYTRDGSSF